MNVDRQDDSHWHFSLGPVEKWVVAGALSMLIGAFGYIGSGFATRLDEQGKTLQRLSEQQAVANAQMLTLTTQLSDVPGLTRAMAETKVRVDDNTRRIGDLEQLRKLR
ncbi:hypothetical protein [Dokdonella soli]